MTRQEKIKALTKYEMEWFLSNGDDWVEDFANFFAEGGFNNWSDEKLDKKMALNFEDDSPVIHVIDGRTLGTTEAK